MLQKLRLLTALSLALFVLTPLAFSAPVVLGKIQLNENSFEKFGALFFPFTFNVPSLGLMFVLCESGTIPGGGCVNNVISDAICVNNNQAGEGVTAMISDLENGLSNLPADFPCNVDSTTRFLKETGKGAGFGEEHPHHFAWRCGRTNHHGDGHIGLGSTHLNYQ